MRKLTAKLLYVAAVLFVLLYVGARPAAADIITVQNVNGSPYIDLSQIQNGYVLANIINGSPSAGSINVINDLGSTSKLTLFFVGSLTSNQFFNGQFAGAFTGTCGISTGGTTISIPTSNGCITGINLPNGIYRLDFNFSTAIATGSSFNIAWSSFANTATGCIAGGTTCVVTPEPSTISLLAAGLLGLAAAKLFAGRRFIF